MNIKPLGEELLRRIQEAFNNKGLNDTGEAKDSLSLTVYDNTIVVDGMARILFLEYGRRAGEAPPFEVIRDWVERKLNIEVDQINSVSWAIVNKIKAQGTNILTDRAKGLELELILNEFLTEFVDSLAAMKADEVVDGLIKEWIE